MNCDIGEWLEQLGLDKYVEVFAENEIDIIDLASLDDADLEKLGLPMGPRKRILNAVSKLSSELETDALTAAYNDRDSKEVGKQTAAQHSEAQRRQLTVMFCDLVGSTALSRQLDPEDMRELMRRYQDAVADVVASYEGHIAKFLGDGVLAYFGWPHAHENQAEWAVRAGLECITAVAAIDRDSSEPLHARVGIATGEVVVGDLVGESAYDAEAVTGETPNLAARLQGVAEPGQVVVGARTRQLLAQTFELADLGPQRLKGFAETMPAWRVVGEGIMEGRFEAAQSGSLTQFVGRQHEIGLLLERWQLAKSGEGQAVLLAGEAGIGKSRMIRALYEQIADDRPFRLNYQCAPHRTNSAFYPIIRRLERACRFSADDTPEGKFNKLEAYLQRTSDNPVAVAPFFAALLSLPGEDRYGPLELTAQQQRERIIAALVEQVLALAQQRPALFILEDAHWVDPSTETLIGEILAAIGPAAVMVLITHRPVYLPVWKGSPHLTSIAMNRLSREQGMEIVRAIGGTSLAEVVAGRILARADGVPLYVEELTKSVMEAGTTANRKGEDVEVPATLQASLMARLDRLGNAKEVAQIGAVIGRVFQHRLIEAVAEAPAASLNAALERIVASELLFRRGSPPDAVYTFKHALVQDSAYASLLRSRRRQLHARIAAVLKESFEETASLEPEVLAHHYTEAEDFDKAFLSWRQAAGQAVARSAHREAIQHLNNCLDVLEVLPEAQQRRNREFDIYTALGHSLLATKGYAATEVADAYGKALELCDQAEQTSTRTSVLTGLFFFHINRPDFAAAFEVAEELVSITQDSEDQYTKVEASTARGMTHFWCGRLDAALADLQPASGRYRPEPARPRDRHDAGVGCLHYLAWTLWYMGYPDKARATCDGMLSLAKELSHPLSTVYALTTGSTVHILLNEGQQAQVLAERAVDVATDYGFDFWLAIANIRLGEAFIVQEKFIEGIDHYLQSIADKQATGSVLGRSIQGAFLASAYRQTGQPARGLELLDKTLAEIQRSGERNFEAELYRVKGELIGAAFDRDAAAAENLFLQGLEVAREQQAKSLEIRSATSLARLWGKSGKREQALQLLSGVYGWFSEGFDTRDLNDAKAMLEALS